MRFVRIFVWFFFLILSIYILKETKITISPHTKKECTPCKTKIIKEPCKIVKKKKACEKIGATIMYYNRPHRIVGCKDKVSKIHGDSLIKSLEILSNE